MHRRTQTAAQPQPGEPTQNGIRSFQWLFFARPTEEWIFQDKDHGNTSFGISDLLLIASESPVKISKFGDGTYCD